MDADNLALACQSCNNFKYDATRALDPVTGNLAPLFHPRRDAWADHFCWSLNGLELIGISPAGRATISRLQLNRPGVVRLRRVLGMMQLHPPLR